MFANGEKSAFLAGDFVIISMDENKIEMQSGSTGQFWLVRKFDQAGYHPVVLYHKHNENSKYHVHFVYGQDNALLAYSEIRQHDRYILKREAKRKTITKLSNIQLLAAMV
jgi:hypothetical protein